MTLQTSGRITLGDVNVELQRSRTLYINMNWSTARQLAQRPAGLIRMSDFYGKSFLTQSIAVDYYQNYRSRFFDWVHGGSGDYRFVNNPYRRYTSSSDWRKYFNWSGIPIGSSWTTVVLLISGASPSFSTYNINFGGIGIYDAYEVYNQFEQRARVLHVNTDFRNISNIYLRWNHVYANAGSWAAMAVIPGRWWWSYTPRGRQSGYETVYGDNITIGTYYGRPNGSNYFVNRYSAASMMLFDAWWYNNGGFFTATNPYTYNLSYRIDCGTLGTVNGLRFYTMASA